MTVRTFEVESPLGSLRCAATPTGLALVTLPLSGDDHEHDLDRLCAARGGRSPVARHPAAEELRRYFAGELRAFTSKTPLDLCLATPFQRRVLTALARVPFGELLTYGDLARRAGRPGAARAVGGAVGKNPVPIVVPCHRVVAAQGRLGGFGGGLSAKRLLLAHEGHAVAGPATFASRVTPAS